METVYQLCRKPAEGSRGVNWRFVNRMVDAEGRTLFVGGTPNKPFKKAEVFKDADGQDAISFGADRNVAPSAFLSKDASGGDLFRIKLPFAAKLRPNSSCQLIAAGSGEQMEIVPAQSATANELNRLVCCFMHEFVVRRGGETVAFSGELPFEDDSEDFAKQTVAGATKGFLSDLRQIPKNVLKMKSGKRTDSPVGRLTVTDPSLGTAFALTLLLFRTYVFKEIQNPEPSWWQGD